MVFLNCKYLTCVFCQASKLKLWWHEEYHAVICGLLVVRAGSPLCPSSLWLCLLQGVPCWVLALSVLSNLTHPFSSSPVLPSLVTTAAEVSAACGRGHLSCLITRLWMGWAGALTNRSHGSGGCWGLLGSAGVSPGCLKAGLWAWLPSSGTLSVGIDVVWFSWKPLSFSVSSFPCLWFHLSGPQIGTHGGLEMGQFTLRISTRNSPSPSCPRFGTLRLSAL